MIHVTKINNILRHKLKQIVYYYFQVAQKRVRRVLQSKNKATKVLEGKKTVDRQEKKTDKFSHSISHHQNNNKKTFKTMILMKILKILNSIYNQIIQLNHKKRCCILIIKFWKFKNFTIMFMMPLILQIICKEHYKILLKL